MSSVEKITKTIGLKNLSSALGVSETAVHNARAEGMFPARWFEVVKAEAERHGISAPESLFKFVRNRRQNTPQVSGESALGEILSADLDYVVNPADFARPPHIVSARSPDEAVGRYVRSFESYEVNSASEESHRKFSKLTGEQSPAPPKSADS